jgi:hypothetical protein
LIVIPSREKKGVNDKMVTFTKIHVSNPCKKAFRHALLPTHLNYVK